MKDDVIVLNNVEKSFKGVRVIDRINLNIKKGNIYGLVGENGAGKSTLLKLITGLMPQTEGSIEIFNDGKDLDRARSRIGSLIESPVFYPYMSARKNLEYYRIQKGIIDRDIVDTTLEKVGLKDVGKKKYSKFSLGMKQRLGIALALIDSPEILILDEPINGLDPTGIVELRDILLDLNREKKMTIIISSHILGELSQIATDYIFIKEGSLLEEISSKRLSEKCRDYIAIEVNDIDKATVLIENELGSLDYKVNNNGTIQLYDFVDRVDFVVEVLYENGIKIKSITPMGTSLESYYIDLIGGRLDA